MIARTFKAKLLVFAIFFIGIATGILIANFYTTRVTGSPDPANPPDEPQRAQRAQHDINEFYDYLGLTEAQLEQMHKIGEETRHQFRELRKETHPRFEAIMEESRSKIQAVLNEDQLVKYDEFRRQMDERRRNRKRDERKNDGEPRRDGGQRPN